MVIERRNNETIIRIPDNDEAFGANELQQLKNKGFCENFGRRFSGTQVDYIF